jgi:hypothetical protein
LKQSLAERAEKVKKELEMNYGLTPKEVANLTKVSFYDIFFLCGGPSYFRLIWSQAKSSRQQRIHAEWRPDRHLERDPPKHHLLGDDNRAVWRIPAVFKP